jgi:hypothetical protein
MHSGGPPLKESKRYFKKDGELEASLVVDHARFKAGDDLVRRRLIFQVVLRCVSENRRALPTEALESANRLEDDLKAFGREKGWYVEGGA